MLNNSSFLQSNQCTNIYISTFSIRAILLLPVSISILFHSLQKWYNYRSVQTESHFDVFTCHLAAMEFIWVIGLPFHIVAHLYNHSVMTSVTRCLIVIALYGELIFHTLTCAGHYIAVVYPITYKKMKTTRGLRFRNYIIWCVWLLCLFMSSLNFFNPPRQKQVPLLCLLASSLTVTSFCTISVLYFLTCPFHGEEVGQKKADQSKRRAFNIIITISSVQWLWFIGVLVSKLLTHFYLISLEASCLVSYGVFFLNLPSCLVMPILYLHKAGKPDPHRV